MYVHCPLVLYITVAINNILITEDIQQSELPDSLWHQHFCDWYWHHMTPQGQNVELKLKHTKELEAKVNITTMHVQWIPLKKGKLNLELLNITNNYAYV